ncbi:MAG: carboxypeptidase M32 [Rhodospirillales bacterium CG15_BIG_FIL_POST_REV_8_21_14_020_66_15]|nr:MAG: carboxypeptidase M32 [Rhodospirillales bacterium CG15_BIG_FIL_POST_REV_8_21_14_020_66_15]
MPDSTPIKDAAASSPYARLEQRFRRLNALSEAQEVLHWDMSTVMPRGGHEARAEQLAELAAVHHALLTGAETGDLIAAATAETDNLNDWQRANLREITRRYVKATALSEDLVTRLSRAASACEAVWRDARAANDFKAVEPYVAELLVLVREKARAKADVLGLSLYDALLADYEPGGRSAEIDAVFGELEAFLPDFLGEVLEHQARGPGAVLPAGPFPEEKQKALGRRFMEMLGFDFHHGRLDVSLHPFCGGTPDDVRITTRYDESDFTSALMGVLHETGHAMYERGLPKDWRGQPVGHALGMSVHESQSLLVEMQVCRSRTFLDFAAPVMRETFGGEGPAWEADNLFRLYTKVERSFIRVDADEVTYPAHVILRYRLEKALIEGDMEIPDLPGAWNDGMERLLGILPPTDTLGCLQDIHWYDGAWGYFPTYTLGAMTAAQLYAAARNQNPEIEPAIGRGDFAPLMAWLRANVHGKGSFETARDLLIAATGEPLNPKVFENHLRTRYLAP